MLIDSGSGLVWDFGGGVLDDLMLSLHRCCSLYLDVTTPEQPPRHHRRQVYKRALGDAGYGANHTSISGCANIL